MLLCCTVHVCKSTVQNVSATSVFFEKRACQVTIAERRIELLQINSYRRLRQRQQRLRMMGLLPGKLLNAGHLRHLRGLSFPSSKHTSESGE